jgi:hypothetical protein
MRINERVWWSGERGRTGELGVATGRVLRGRVVRCFLVGLQSGPTAGSQKCTTMCAVPVKDSEVRDRDKRREIYLPKTNYRVLMVTILAVRSIGILKAGGVLVIWAIEGSGVVWEKVCCSGESCRVRVRVELCMAMQSLV